MIKTVIIIAGIIIFSILIWYVVSEEIKTSKRMKRMRVFCEQCELEQEVEQYRTDTIANWSDTNAAFVLCQMRDILDHYGFVTVGDYLRYRLQYTDVDPSDFVQKYHKYDDFGWSDLSRAYVHVGTDGVYIRFPEIEYKPKAAKG